MSITVPVKQLKPSEVKDNLTLKANMCKRSRTMGYEVCRTCADQCEWGVEYLKRMDSGKNPSVAPDSHIYALPTVGTGEIPYFPNWLESYLQSIGMSKNKLSQMCGIHSAAFSEATLHGKWSRNMELSVIRALGLTEQYVVQQAAVWGWQNKIVARYV